MSLLFVFFMIQAAVASCQVAPLKDFEEAVLSNNMTPKPADDMDHPLAKPEQEIAASTSHSEVPPQMASLVSDVFAKYHVTNLADLEAAVLAKHQVGAPLSVSQQGSGLKIREAHHKAKAHHSLESQKGSGLKMRTAQHKHHKAYSSEPQKESGLKVHRAHPKDKAQALESQERLGLKLRRAHPEHNKVEAHSSEAPKGPGLKVRKAHHKAKAPSPESQKGSGLQLHRARHSKREAEARAAESQQASGSNVRKHKHNVISKRKHKRNSQDKARFKLKRMTPLSEAPKEVMGTFGQITRVAPSPAQAVEGKKVTENVVIPGMLGDRNQEATKHHVKRALRRAVTPEQVSLAWEEAQSKEKSKKTSRFHSTKASPGGILRTLTRYIFLLAGLCSIAGIAYNKYQGIAAIDRDNAEPQKFKAKQEDTCSFAPAPCFSAQVTAGSPGSAVVGSFRQGLSRRCITDTRSSHGFVV